jgi:hypothetical protein
MKSGAAILLAVLLGIFLAAGQCGSGSADDNGDDGHSSSSQSDDDHGDQQASDEDDSGGDDSDAGQHDDDGQDSGHAAAKRQQLEDQGLTVAQMSGTSDEDCAAHSYGEVRNYFSDHPCRGLERAWYEVRDDEDNRAILSVAWVEMPDPDAANDLQRLVDRPGTGNVTELSKEDGPYQDVRYSGWYYRSGRDGDTFHSVQAEPLADSQGSRDLARQAAGVTTAD